MMMNKKKRGIYIHIPFCNSKCYYCNFNSITNHELMDKYIESLLLEIKLYSKNIRESVIKTIYIGGGTPSILKISLLENIINKLKKIIDFKYVDEFTIECNPNTITKEKLIKYKKMGINRLSIGLQSTHNNLLKKIGREHSYKEFKEKFILAREIGFNNISLDLIFGLPYQNLKSWVESLEEIVKLSPEHLSAYSLSIEPGTVLYNRYNEIEKNLPNEDLDREMYYKMIEYLESKNYFLYEVSNMAKKGYESKHNLSYWKRREYIGLGVSAHGFINNLRYGNYESIEEYSKFLLKNRFPRKESGIIAIKESFLEEIMLGLRLKEGIDLSEINKKYKMDFESKYIDVINLLNKEKLIKLNNNKLSLTIKGFSISNSIIEKFI